MSFIKGLREGGYLDIVIYIRCRDFLIVGKKIVIVNIYLLF